MKYLFTILLLAYSTTLLYGQKIKYKYDIFNTSRYYDLIISENKSLYIHHEEGGHAKIDDINIEILQNWYEWIHYYKDNEFTGVKKLDNKTFVFCTGKYEELKWDITGETKEILGYTCIKALGRTNHNIGTELFGNNVVAWFCPDIPYSTGPEGYHGLPGVILSLSEGKASHIIAIEIAEVTEKINDLDTTGMIQVDKNTFTINDLHKRRSLLKKSR